MRAIELAPVLEFVLQAQLAQTCPDPVQIRLVLGRKVPRGDQPRRRQAGPRPKPAVRLDQHVKTGKPDYDKAAFAQAAEACEKHMDLKPLKSSIRGTG